MTFFDEAFQLSCLLDVSLRHSPKIIEQANMRLGDQKFYYCVDEAQGDIDTLIQTPDYTISLLTLWAEELSQISISWGKIQFGKKLSTRIHPLIFSGTSLRTTNAIKAIKFERNFPFFNNWRECCVFSTFPLVRDDEQFKTAMSEHGLQDLVQNVPLELIVEHAKPLYGRPAWSVWYLKNVKRILRDKPAEDLTEEEIKNASNETVNKVKDNLKFRLRELDLEGKTNSIVEDLCRVVVWSDLTDRPTHFWDDTGPKMIEQAFAVTRKISGGKTSDGITSDETLQYMLEERLALDAAKEYILTVGSDLVFGAISPRTRKH